MPTAKSKSQARGGEQLLQRCCEDEVSPAISDAVSDASVALMSASPGVALGDVYVAETQALGNAAHSNAELQSSGQTTLHATTVLAVDTVMGGRRIAGATSSITGTDVMRARSQATFTRPLPIGVRRLINAAAWLRLNRD